MYLDFPTLLHFDPFRFQRSGLLSFDPHPISSYDMPLEYSFQYGRGIWICLMSKIQSNQDIVALDSILCAFWWLTIAPQMPFWCNLVSHMYFLHLLNSLSGLLGLLLSCKFWCLHCPGVKFSTRKQSIPCQYSKTQVPCHWAIIWQCHSYLTQSRKLSYKWFYWLLTQALWTKEPKPNSTEWDVQQQSVMWCGISCMWPPQTNI